MSPLATGRVGFRNDPEAAPHRRRFGWWRRPKVTFTPTYEWSAYQPALRSRRRSEP